MHFGKNRFVLHKQGRGSLDHNFGQFGKTLTELYYVM